MRRAPSPAPSPRARGKFEQAEGGTLLLDEIGEMDPRLQAKILRAIQEREIDRLGGNAPVKIDVRILAATHRDLATEVARGRFREDLYFRLAVVRLRIPPLRERPGDILPLARHFAERYAARQRTAAARADAGGRGAAAGASLAAATCARSRTRCTAPCCSPKGRRSGRRRSTCWSTCRCWPRRRRRCRCPRPPPSPPRRSPRWSAGGWRRSSAT